jgi:hypothetical protein
LFERAPSTNKWTFILRHADHQHFADAIDEPGLCAPEQAHLFTRALGLAHFDAVLKGNVAAQQFLNNDPVAALRARGVDAVEYATAAD